MKFRWIILFLQSLILIFLSPVHCFAQETETPEELKSLYAKGVCLMDADSQRVLFSKNGDVPLPMASTTKIMTCIVTLENADINELVTVSKLAARQPDVQLNINTGEQYVLGDLLYSLMLESHNDAAVAIAEHVGGSVEGFADMMNKKAKEIGCNATYFISPNGLDTSDNRGTHSTSPNDLARIMSYCITRSEKTEQFLEITRTPNYTFTNKVTKEDGTVQNGSRSFSCNNHNAFLSMMEGALSGKTGFTGNAGYCYVGSLRKDGKTFVVALLACGWPNNKTYKWSDTKKLMNYGLKYYKKESIQDIRLDEDKLSAIPVDKGQTAQIGDTSYVAVSVIDTGINAGDTILLKDGEKIEVHYKIEKELEAPVSIGQKVGTIQYTLNQQILKQQDVVLADSVKRIDLYWCLEKVFDLFAI